MECKHPISLTPWLQWGTDGQYVLAVHFPCLFACTRMHSKLWVHACTYSTYRYMGTHVSGLHMCSIQPPYMYVRVCVCVQCIHMRVLYTVATRVHVCVHDYVSVHMCETLYMTLSLISNLCRTYLQRYACELCACVYIHAHTYTGR